MSRTYITRIVLKGFKSFNKKVAIPFLPGFNIICGPNGSGKSNIVDAISFALGRTSVKSMRVGRLHELIYHGGNGKKPAEYASVTLYLDNSQKVFPFEEKEISITRKVNRKGVCVYKLNGKTTTREKIVNLLASARIHPNGHNIVLQGDVTSVIEMNPVERRMIIDEISGIAEYNEKKEKALKNLEQVDAKLREAEIIITERYEIFKKLEEERNAALRYQELQKEIEILKASLVFKKMEECNKKMEKIEEEVEKKQKEVAALEEEIRKVENELEQKEKALREVLENLGNLSKMLEVEKQISYLRTKMLVDKDKIDSYRAELERIDSLINRLREIDKKEREMIENPAIKEILKENIPGVHGTVESLIRVSEEYKVAIEVAAANHLFDLVVDTHKTAMKCIELLKSRKVGRATFLPLNKIKPKVLKERELLNKEGVIGVASELISYDPKFKPAIDFVFGNTLIVRDLKVAEEVGVGRVRMVTLDGDLVERSGAMTGGFYAKKKLGRSVQKEIEEYEERKSEILGQIKKLEEEIQATKLKLEEMSKSEEARKMIDLEKMRIDREDQVDMLRKRRKMLYEKRLVLQEDLNKLKIERAKLEAELENLKIEAQKYGEIQVIDKSVRALEMAIRKAEKEIMELGPVNFKAIEQYEKFKEEFEGYRKRYEKILEEKKAILEMIEEIEKKRREVFYSTLQEVSKKFDEIFRKMVGGSAKLELEDPNDLESGLLIQANPAGKMLLNIDAMSGGEKTITALAFLFALQEYRPAPFYVLDEIDAALDKENTKKVADLIKELSKKAQFIVITHNDTMIKSGDRVYGVTMSEGESKILGLELPR